MILPILLLMACDRAADKPAGDTGVVITDTAAETDTGTDTDTVPDTPAGVPDWSDPAYAVCGTDLTPDGLASGSCTLVSRYTDRYSGQRTLTTQLEDGLQRWELDSTGGETQYAYDTDGLLRERVSSSEWFEMVWGYTDGQLTSFTRDDDGDGIIDQRVTYTDDSGVLTVVTDDGDDGAVDLRRVTTDDTTLHVRTTLSDIGDDGIDDELRQEWYNPCGDVELVQTTDLLTGDVRLVRTTYDYDERGLPLQVWGSYDDGEGVLQMWTHTYLDTGHLEHTTYFLGESDLQGTWAHDWGACALDSVDSAGFRPQH